MYDHEEQQIDCLFSLVERAVDAWPQFDNDAPVNGSDMVEWFGRWRKEASQVLSDIAQGK